MPATVRRPKLKRKELRQPDEFTTFFERAAEFVDENFRNIMLACGGIIAAGAIAIGIFYLEQSRARAAAAQFSGALAALSGGNYKQAEEQFNQLAGRDPNRRLGQLARFYLGSAYLEAGDLPKARDALNAFIAGENDPMFLGMAQMNLAVVYEQMGDWGRAADAYGQAAAVAGPDQMRAELGVARALDKQGKKDAAIAEYRRFIAAHPFAPQREEAMESLAMLGVATEPASAPVPAPPPKH